MLIDFGGGRIAKVYFQWSAAEVYRGLLIENFGTDQEAKFYSHPLDTEELARIWLVKNLQERYGGWKPVLSCNTYLWVDDPGRYTEPV